MAAAGAADEPVPAEEKIPITLLSGFLGAGKTTLLREVLQNKGGLKVAVVVNDVAKINIDSKLVRERTSGSKDGELTECVELQNGCACCNASEELLDALLQLLRVAARRGSSYDRILIELSGVAEPKNIRREFVEAAEEGHIALDQAALQTMITVVDGPSFSALYQSRDEIHQRPDLCSDEPEPEVDSDRKVVDLLVEQVECADCVVLNKKDLCTPEQLETLSGIVATINPLAKVVPCEWGKLPLELVMGPPSSSSWVCNADDEDDLRAAVRAAKEQSKKRKEPPASDHTAHGHSHGHEHEHGHGGEEECKVCTSDAPPERATATTAQTKYGISSFVYARRRPFHPKRLMKAIMALPVKVDPATGASVDEWTFPEAGAPPKGAEADTAPMKAIIRSKGFVWVANQHRSAQYWSHAGHYFELRALGLWWAATSLDAWPDEGRATSPEVRKIAADFAPPVEGAACWGDRRQEIVFIGIRMEEARISALLDECLLTDEEMATYATQAQGAPADAVKVDPASGNPLAA